MILTLPPDHPLLDPQRQAVDAALGNVTYPFLSTVKVEPGGLIDVVTDIQHDCGKEHPRFDVYHPPRFAIVGTVTVLTAEPEAWYPSRTGNGWAECWRVTVSGLTPCEPITETPCPRAAHLISPGEMYPVGTVVTVKHRCSLCNGEPLPVVAGTEGVIEP
jgi:hypothetical protein